LFSASDGLKMKFSWVQNWSSMSSADILHFVNFRFDFVIVLNEQFEVYLFMNNVHSSLIKKNYKYEGCKTFDSRIKREKPRWNMRDDQTFKYPL
jgi:hypothetical protein